MQCDGSERVERTICRERVVNKYRMEGIKGQGTKRGMEREEKNYLPLCLIHSFIRPRYRKTWKVDLTLD